MQSLKKIKTDLKNRKLYAKHDLGQHFLLDEYTIRLIVTALDIQSDDTLVEIGSGTGQLTQFIWNKGHQFTAIEKDHAMVELLLERYPAIQILEEDILEVKAQFWNSLTPPVKVVGNLPYYITTPILEQLVLNAELFNRIIVMVQAEVAQRITAKPVNKSFGRLSLFLQNRFEITVIKQVSGRHFYPQTQVRSTVLQLIPRTQPLVPASLTETFEHLAKAIFTSRRKNILNSLTRYPYFKPIESQIGTQLQTCDIDPRTRGETLSFEKLIELAQTLKSSLTPGGKI